MLLGRDAIDKLHNAHVAVFGVGGVGSFCAEALARAGIGSLTLVDDDVVSVSNLNRQLVALHSTVGKSKVQVMADRIRDIDPACHVQAVHMRYEAENRDDFFQEPYDYIADAIDSVSCKIDLIQTALQRNIPIISSMGTGNKLDPTKFQITDLSKTSGCPLARVMRKELRDRSIVHHTVLYSTEPALKPVISIDTEGRRSVPGSVSWVPSCAGMMLAGYIVQQILKDE
jgi:tRNA A37 threonylcarbamoyladenosine dehydratase